MGKPLKNNAKPRLIRPGPDPDPDEDLELARRVLREVAQDGEAPPAARAGAARTLLELIGALGRHAAPPPDPSRALSEMDAGELRAELARLRRMRAAPDRA